MGLERLARLDSKAGREGIEIGVGVHLRRIDVEFLAPDELGLKTLFDDGFKEAAKHGQAIAGADAGQAGVVRQGLIEVVAQKPSHAELVCHQPHQEPLRADALEKHDQL